MHLDPEEWTLLSRLLDEVLALPEGEWFAWLERQTALDPALRSMLRQRLADEIAGHGEDGLPSLPQYTDVGGAASPAALLLGTTIGPYRIVGEIGRGGMGSVWLAERSDGVLKRPVALKLPHSGAPAALLGERLARERDILAALAHPNIARLYDAGLSETGQPYLALEYIEGRTLLDDCKARGLDLAARLRLFLQIADAVQYAHGQLVVHRDIKPGNILVSADGQVHLLDFGVAKLLQRAEPSREMTETLALPMTPQYAAPEQILGQPVGIATDIYALGLVLYDLIADARPYRPARDTRGALEQAILEAEPMPPSQAARGRVAWADALRGDLDTIVLKALRKLPEQRYTTVAALADDIRRHLAGEPVLARPPSFAYRSGKFLRRHRWPVAGGAVALLALVVTLGAALWQMQVARQQTAVARKEAATAQAINDFMQGVFLANSAQQEDPAQARNKTARELLDIAAGRIDESLKAAPEAKLALLTVFVEIYGQLGLFDRALAMMERQVDATRQLHGAASAELAESLLQLHLARRQHDVDDPGQATALAEAGRVLDALPEASLPARSVYRINAAEYYIDHDPSRARALLAEAVALNDELTRRPLDTADETSTFVKAARLALQMGDCQAARTQADRGADRSRQYIDHARSEPGGSGYMTLAPSLEMGGRARRCLGDPAGAVPLLREAAEASRKTFGPDDLDTLRAEAHLAAALLALGPSDEAERLRQHTVALLTGHGTQDRSRGHFDALAATARLQLDARQFAGALELAQRARALRDPKIEASPALAEVLRVEAAALAALGRHADAAGTLARAVALREKAEVRAGPALAEEQAIAAKLGPARGPPLSPVAAAEGARP